MASPMGRLLTVNDTFGEYPPSYYAATADRPEPLPSVAGQLSCDVCVIGGGYTGLSAALHLAEQGADTVLVEAHRIGWGASGRNGGQLGSGQRRSQTELERRLGVDHARQLWEIAEAAKRLVKALIERHRIDCDLKPGAIHADHRARFVADTHRYVEKLRAEYGYEQIEPLSREEIRGHLGTDCYHGGTIDRGAAHLHPLNYALGLGRAARAAGVRVFERCPVLGYTAGAGCRVRCANGHVDADAVIIACNGYLERLGAGAGDRTMPINNYIIATEPLPEEFARELIRDDVAVSDSKFVINYYRLSADRRLLFGGGESYRYTFPRDIKSFVRPHMLAIYPQLADTKIDYGWGGTLAVTRSRLPCFGHLAHNVLIAGGYSGHGVGMATIAGQILAETIDGSTARMEIMERIRSRPFPGGRWLRWPLLAMAMTYYSLRDRF